jgi:hypothetical protein
MMVIIFFIGVFIGAMVGFLAMGLCQMAKKAEESEEMHQSAGCGGSAWESNPPGTAFTAPHRI